MMNGVSSSRAPAHASSYRRFRLAVVVLSVVAAIVGSVVLATHRSHERVRGRAGSTPTAQLQPSGKVIARIRVGRGGLPVRGGGALAIGEGAVWAMSDIRSMLMRIDPARNTVTASIHVGPQPQGIAVSPGAVWIANAGGPSVSRIDPATNRVVATIRVGPNRVCCAEHTNVIASPSAVWVAVPYWSRLVRIDPATNRVVARAALDYEPCGYLADDSTGAVWSAACGGDVVGRVDPRTNELTARVAEVDPVGLKVAFGSVWVAASGSGNVDRIDPRTGRLVGRLHVVGLIVRLGASFG